MAGSLTPDSYGRPATSSATSRSRPTKARDPERGHDRRNAAIVPVSVALATPPRYPSATRIERRANGVRWFLVVLAERRFGDRAGCLADSDQRHPNS
jgi:hypothetical protein